MSTWWERRLAQESSTSPQSQQQVQQPRRLPEAVRPRRDPTPVEDLCPSCSSENYLAPTASTAKRCYDCGYPVVQSGTGVSSGRHTGATKKATQVKGGGYSPGTIVGRVQ